MQRADSREDVRRIRTGTPACLEQATRLPALQERLEQHLFGLAGHEPCPKLGQDGVMEASVREVYTQGLLPVKTTAHRLSRRAIRETL